MKKICKIGMCLFLLCSVFLTNIKVVNAASFSAWSNVSTVAPGGSFTVTFGGDCIGRVNISVSNGTISATEAWVENNYMSVNVKAGSSGTVSVTLTPTAGFSDSNANEYNPGSRTVYVTVKQPQNNSSSGGSSSSSNNSSGSSGSSSSSTIPDEEEEIDVTLKSLTVSEGELSPAFNKATHEYEVVVQNKVEKIEVKAEASDANASVSGTGEVTLKDKETKVNVEVKNEDETGTYTITIIKETPVITIDGIGILNEYRNADMLEGFEEHKIMIDDVEVISRKNPITNIVVVYAMDEEGNKSYYLFDEKKKAITSIYKPIALLGNNYAMIDVPKKLQNIEGLKFGKVSILDQEFKGWTYKDKSFKNYVLVYLMNKDGEAHMYQFDTKEQTLQIYDNSAAISQKTYNALKEEAEMYKMLTFVLAPLAGVVAFISLVLAILMKKKKK